MIALARQVDGHPYKHQKKQPEPLLIHNTLNVGRECCFGKSNVKYSINNIMEQITDKFKVSF